MSITIGDALLYLKTDNAGLQSGMASARKTATTELRYMAKSVATDLGISSKSLASFASFAGSAALGIGVAVGGAAVVAGVAKQAYTDLILPAVDYGLAVGDLSTKIGVNAEESSKLIQIMDDLRIENQTMLTAFRFLNAQGIQPTIANLKEASEKYRAIVDPVEKARFATELFGARAGPEMQKLLEVGGEALEQYAQDAKAAGLVITDMTVQNSKDFYAMKDSFEDTVSGLKIQLGTILMPVATAVFGGIDASIKEVITDFGDLEANGVPTIFKLAEAIAQAGHDFRDNALNQWALDAGNATTEAGFLKNAIDELKDKTITINTVYTGGWGPGGSGDPHPAYTAGDFYMVWDSKTKAYKRGNRVTNTNPLGQGKAGGGDVEAGTAYPVGEEGPEIFVPGQDGTIIPNKEIGGATYNYFLTAQYGFQSERSLRDDVRVLELLHG